VIVLTAIMECRLLKKIGVEKAAANEQEVMASEEVYYARAHTHSRDARFDCVCTRKAEKANRASAEAAAIQADADRELSSVRSPRVARSTPRI
jgi:hypothetical protein